MIRRDFWQMVLASVIVAVGAVAAEAQGFGRGGGGMPTTEESFNRIDRNGSGAIEPEEWETLPAPIRRLYEDLTDLSVPMNYDDFAEVSQKMREQMMSRFGGGRGMDFGRGGGDFGRRDRSRDEFDEGDRRGDDGGSRRSRGGFGGGRGFGGTDDESASAAGNADKKAEKPSGKVTRARTPINLKLPEQYRARDTDRDGQIGLYEWSRSDYAGFQKLDRNGDGFLTPQELSRAGGVTAPASPRSESGDASSGKVSEATIPTATAAAAPRSAADTAFNLIDKDKDGSLSEAEWGKSILASKKFKDAGIEVRFPLSRAQFQQNYPKAYNTTGN